MGEEDVCMQCRSLREEACWANFKVTQFYQVLSSGFDKQLEIPQSFSNHLQKLPETVTLIGPSGKTWTVGLTTNETAVFFRRGWKEFVQGNFLQEKDLLIFKYIGDSIFDVQIFDGQSLCEKAASYYVRKCGHGDCIGGFQRKRKNVESSSTAGLTSPQDGNGDTSPEKSPTNWMDSSRWKTTMAQAVTHFSPSATDGDYNGGFQRKRKKGGSSSTAGLTSPQDGNGDTSPEQSPTKWMDSFRRKTTVTQGVTGKMRGQINFTPAHFNPSATDEEIEIKPGTKLATDEEIEIKHGTDLATERGMHNSLQLARAAVTNEGFIVVMKTSHVIRKFYLTIPFKWMCKHLGSMEEQNIILRMRDKIWTTRLYYHKSRNYGWIAWKRFVMDNDLHECDVCMFEPATQINNCVALHVHIYRALPDALQ